MNKQNTDAGPVVRRPSTLLLGQFPHWLFGVVAAGVMALAVPASADVNVIFTDDGTNTTASYSGSLITTGLGAPTTHNQPTPYIRPNVGWFGKGGAVFRWTNVTSTRTSGGAGGPFGYGSGAGTAGAPLQQGGDGFLFIPAGNRLEVPSNYVSGNPINGFVRYPNVTVAGLGIVNTVYTLPGGQIIRIIIADANEAPTVTCPVAVSEECVAGGADVLLEAEVFDADGDDLDVQWQITYPDSSMETINDTVSFGNPPVPATIALNGGLFRFPLGTSSVSLRVDDGNSEIAACTINVTVEDTTDPVILTLMERVEVGTDPGECFATVDLDSAPYAPEFSDLCSPNVTASHNAPATFDVGETTVAWTVDDGNGNMITVYQTVVVSDQEAPTGTAPADVVIGHDVGTCEATLVELGMPVADDNCGVDSITITNDAVEPFLVGDTEVNWYISDAAGNTFVVTQKVTVTNQDPIANAGLDLVLECNSNAGRVVTLDGTASSDPDVGDILTYHWEAVDITFDDPDSPTPTATFPLGSTTVQLTVEDQCGGVDTIDLLIIIEDNTAPQIQAALVDKQVLWPPNHEMIPVAIDLLVSDLCTAPEDLLLSCFVTSSEVDDGLGDGAFTGDVDGQDGHAHDVAVDLSYNPATGRWEGTMLLRAERSGTGNGRKYSIRCLAMDDSNNVTEATVCVTVPKSRGRGR